MSTILSGPSMESASTPEFEAQACLSCRTRKSGAHYNHYIIKAGMDSLRCIFPDGEANEMNFALFSTSGVHGSYTTIEEIEESLTKYGEDYEVKEDEDWPDDYHGNNLTVQIIQPRICCLRYGTFDVKLADIPYLKKLRDSSWKAVQKIGK